MDSFAKHERCFACSPVEKGGLGIEFSLNGEGVLRGRWVAEERFQSYDGILHGGIIAALLDAAMTHCLLMQGISALTGRLSVRYHTSVRIGATLDVEAKVSRRVGRLFIVDAEIREGTDVLARAEGRLMTT